MSEVSTATFYIRYRCQTAASDSMV